MCNFSIEVLIIEDDKIILSSLKEYLENWEYEAFANSGIDIIGGVRNVRPGIILMDIILPSFNGYFWCEKIRDTTDIPIVSISSKSEDLDIIMGMQMRADDYITRPFNSNVLMVKINAVMKRYYGNNTIRSALDFSDVVLLISESRLEYIDKDADLTKTEMLILKLLFEAKGEIMIRGELMDQCWQDDFFVDDNTLAVNINRIRKKLNRLSLDNFLLAKKYSKYYLDDGSNQNK